MRHPFLSLVLFCVVGCGFSSPEQADPPPPPLAPPPAALNLVDVPVAEVLSALAEATSTTLVVDPYAQELATCARITVVSAGPQSIEATFTLVAEAIRPSGLTLTRTDNGTVVHREPDAEPPPGCRRPRRRVDRSRIARPPRRSEVSAEHLASVRRVGPNEYALLRSSRDALFGEPDRLAASARIIPHMRNGENRGFKLYGVRRTSLIGSLGIRNGDLITAVDGHSITTPESALSVYTSLDNADSVVVSIARRGRPLDMTYRLVDTLPAEWHDPSERLGDSNPPARR